MSDRVQGVEFHPHLEPRRRHSNRAIPDDEFENFVDRFARRVSTFDRHFAPTPSVAKCGKSDDRGADGELVDTRDARTTFTTKTGRDLCLWRMEWRAPNCLRSRTDRRIELGNWRTGGHASTPHRAKGPLGALETPAL